MTPARARLDRGGSLRAALRRLALGVAASGAAAGASGCCAPLLERWEEGTSSSRVVAMPADLVRLRPDPGRPLPASVCEPICGHADCFPATLEGGSRVVSEVVVCNTFVAGSCRDTNWFRMPSGRRVAVTRGSVAATFEALSVAEAASAEDFVALSRELALVGAPARLRRRARAAAADERAHDQVMRRLARRATARPVGRARMAIAPARRAPAGRARGPRSLLRLALENARLGCVGESWGALLAAVQAARAPDRAVRLAYAGIARDEARHAALALALHDWLMPRLSAAERAQVVRSFDRALDRIAAARGGPEAGVRRALGLPGEDERALLARGLREVLAPGRCEGATGR